MDETRPHRSAKDLIENLLFLAEEPLTLNRLAESLPHSKEEIAAALDALQAECQDRGLKLRFVSGGWELTSDPTLSEEIERFFNLHKRRRLSRQAVETLAVIAYNQPITRAEIEAVRGVGTSGTLATLQECGLIRVTGQKETVGYPYLYGTTDEFLRHFGLGAIAELPPLEFEREGLTKPLSAKTEPDAEKDVSITEEEETGITPVDFELAAETAEEPAHVQQKGA